MGHSPRFDFTVPESLAGARLDRAIAELAPTISRGEARRLIAAGVVFVAGKRTGICSRTVRKGERVYWDAPAVLRPDLAGPEPRIMIERPELWIIDKPAGMPVEPTRAGVRGTLVDWLRRTRGGGFITHRLDAATSGLLAVARDRATQATLNEMFAAHAIDRRYLTVVSPAPAWTKETFDAPLDQRPALTYASVLARADAAALLLVKLQTGRTRQIRRHLAAAGLPVVGESATGHRTGGRLLLHAFALMIPPLGSPSARGNAVSAMATPPDDFVAAARALGLALPAVESLI